MQILLIGCVLFLDKGSSVNIVFLISRQTLLKYLPTNLFCRGIIILIFVNMKFSPTQRRRERGRLVKRFSVPCLLWIFVSNRNVWEVIRWRGCYITLLSSLGNKREIMKRITGNEMLQCYWLSQGNFPNNNNYYYYSQNIMYFPKVIIRLREPNELVRLDRWIFNLQWRREFPVSKWIMYHPGYIPLHTRM